MVQLLQTSSEHLGIDLDEFVRVSLVHDATTLLLFDQSRQVKVHSANVFDHITTLFSTKNAAVPGALVGLQAQMNALMNGQIAVILE